MLKIFVSLLTIVIVSFHISAQCGIYFEDTKRQAFSNSFANGYFEDFDGDGLEDLFGYSATRDQYSVSSDYQIHYYKRLSSDSFDVNAKSSSITNVHLSQSNAHGVFGVIGDVNADGNKDLIVSRLTSSQTLVTYLNDGEGRFVTTTPAVDAIPNERIWAAGDLNNDGKADLLSTTFSQGTSALYYRLAQPDDSFGAPVFVTTINGSPVNGDNVFGIVGTYVRIPSFPVLVEDLDNDGSNEIAFVETHETSQDTYRLHVLTNDGSMTFAETLSATFGRPTTRLRTFDLNNDGKKDFVSHPNGNRFWLAINNGDNTFSVRSELLPGGGFRNTYDNSFHTKEFSIGDLDSDGDIDILYPGTEWYVVLRNQGDQTFVQEQVTPFLSIDANVDLDNDGKIDALSLIRPLIDGAYRIYDGNNYHYFSLHSAVSFRRNVCGPLGQTKIVDFNGDGYTDRSFWDPSTGIWRSSKNDVLFPSTGEITFQWGLGSLGDVPVPNDYDADGKTDYAVFRRSSGTWWIYRSSDGQYYSQQFGVSEDKPVPADYDGDGKADIAVFRPSTGDWHLWLSESNQYSALHFGVSEDKPVPIDYDGDGKADIAVYRPSTGIWYRINSSDSSFAAVQYGIATDIPLPADYDGDGKANIAVFRDGVWYVLRQDLSTTVLAWGIAGDEPFFQDAVVPRLYVHRRSTSTIYFTNTTAVPQGAPAFPTGSTANDVLVSSTLPPSE